MVAHENARGAVMYQSAAHPRRQASGWLAGGHAGANWQTGRWLAGLDGQGLIVLATRKPRVSNRTR